MKNDFEDENGLSVQSSRELSLGDPAKIALQHALERVFGTLGGPSLDNFDGDDIARWRLQSIATGPDVKKIDDVPAEGIAVKYFYAHPVELDGPTDGEVTEAIRCVLIDDQGVAYGFISNMLARDLARMIAVFGCGVWDPAIKVKIKVNPGKKGHKFFSIVPV